MVREKGIQPLQPCGRQLLGLLCQVVPHSIRGSTIAPLRDFATVEEDTVEEDYVRRIQAAEDINVVEADNFRLKDTKKTFY